MKMLLYLAVAAGVPVLLCADDQTAASAHASHRDTTIVTTVKSRAARMVAPDRFTMSAGSVAAIRGSETERLTNDVKLLDGTIVTSGGTVRRQDGTETELADGQSIGMDGKLGPVPHVNVIESGAVDSVPAIKPQ